MVAHNYNLSTWQAETGRKNERRSRVERREEEGRGREERKGKGVAETKLPIFYNY